MRRLIVGHQPHLEKRRPASGAITEWLDDRISIDDAILLKFEYTMLRSPYQFSDS
jgi:hypothetical protein